MKKEEILEKLKKAEFIGGFGKLLEVDRNLLEKAEKELKTDFIPELYDKTMNKMFGEKYYELSDDEKLEKEKKVNFKLINDKENELLEEEDKDDINEEEYERELAKPLKQ